MKKTPFAVAALAIGAAVVQVHVPAQAQAITPDKTARGQYLVNTSGCHDCHTPFKMDPSGPEPDMARMLSGHPQDMTLPPVPVLSPGPVADGVGRQVLPPMPTPAYRQMNDADLEAIHAHLRSVPPLKNRVPEPWAPTAGATAAATAPGK